ncbi:MAG: TonB-dependent receptor [Acidobacteria bacterium]|nr:TonB-dependent receptor [Acidobacteriota bacterium]
MRRYLCWLFAFALLIPAHAAAQQNASVQGSIVDESAGALPGATVTATEANTGFQSLTVTTEDGRFRLDNLPPGQYLLRVEMPGFATTEVPSLELLVGANARLAPMSMKLATLEETVTVTGETPLVDVTSSQVAGNIDRRQMAELPLQGRNWQELSLMVKGVTANNVTNTPGASDGQFQLNLDGQQITQRVAGSGFGQPKVSREAIAEFQIVTNMFDITQGRSTGMQVQAVSRAGTNDLRAVTYGFFRSDKFNAPDPVAGEVLPFQNQQAGFTVGGPIARDKAHFFASYEYEREPSTAFLQPTRLPNQTFRFETKSVNKNYLGRVDYQHSPTDTFTVRGQRWDFNNPFDISSGTAHPSTAEQLTQRSTNVFGTWTHVISSNLMLQVHGGYNGFSWFNDAIPSNDVQFYQTPFFVPQISFPGLTLGGQRNYPNYTWQDTLSSRGDLTWNTDRHEMKFGAEFLRVKDTKNWSLNRRGTYVFATRPSDAELERRFPADAWDDPSQWDLSGLEANLQRFDINFHPDYLVDTPRPTLALWFGDNWRVSDTLSVNVGVRYDADWGATNPPFVTDNVILIDNGVESRDFGYKTGIRDLNNVAPRVGFAYNVGGTGDLVIRGGSGIYYATPVSNVTYSHQFYNRAVAATFLPDGPGFIENPTRGVTAEDYLTGRVPAPVQTARIIADDYVMPYSLQSSIGFQKQLGAVMGFDVDLTHLSERNQVWGRDPNLFFDPVTGYNLDPARAGRPNPEWGEIQWMESKGKSEALLLATSFTRRFRNNFQGGVTYTRTLRRNDNTTGFGIQANNQFDLEDEWSRSTDFQRDTFRANGIVNLPGQITLGASFFYGSGAYYNATRTGRPFNKPGTNRLNTGAPITIPAAVLSRWEGPAVIATGAEWPRNALRGLPLHKLDMRVSKIVRFSSSVEVTLLAEVFNVFNRKNYGNYQTQLDSAVFGQPVASSGNAYVPRTGQVGFRLAF